MGMKLASDLQISIQQLRVKEKIKMREKLRRKNE